MRDEFVEHGRRFNASEGPGYYSDRFDASEDRVYSRERYSSRDVTSGPGYQTRKMAPNNGMNSGILKEDMSRPCGLPMGAIQKDMGNGAYFSMNGYRVGDLYEQVDKSMREDSAAVKTLTKPHNW
jgi:hypothetical protein